MRGYSITAMTTLLAPVIAVSEPVSNNAADTASGAGATEPSTERLDMDHIELEEMTPDDEAAYTAVVRANRNDSRQFEAPRSLEVVGRKEIEKKQLRSLPEVVGDSGGVFLQQTNRGAGAPIIRGLLGPWNLILIDGVPFNTSTYRTGPNQYLALFDQNAVERLGILKGPASVRFGSGAMGGVMQLFTVTPSFDDDKNYDYAGRARVGFASADLSPSGTFELSSKAGPLSMLMGGSFARFFDMRAGNGKKQPLSAYSARNVRAKAVFAPRDSWSLTGAYFGNAVSNAGRTDSAGVGDVRVYDNEDHLAYLRFDKKRQGIVDHLTLTVSYHRLDEALRRWDCATSETTEAVSNLDACIAERTPAVIRKRRYSDTVHVLGGAARLGLTLWEERLSLNTKGEFYQELVDSKASDARVDDAGNFPFIEQQRGNFSDGSTYSTAGLLLSGDLLAAKVGDDIGELHLSGGVRFSYIMAEAPDVPDFGDVHYAHSGVVFSSGLQWLTADRLNIFAVFNQGFRAPNLLETTVFKDTGSKFEVPSDHLKPERSNTFELGTNIRLAPVTFSVSAFYSILDDLIDEAPGSYNGADTVEGVPVVERANAAKARYRGVEGAFSLALWQLTLSSNLAYLRADVEGPDGISYPGRRIPPLFGRVSLQFESKRNRYDVEAFVDYALRQDRLHPSDQSDLRICETSLHSGILDESCDGSPAWYTLNFRGGITLTGWLRADISVLNITDRYYRPHGSGFYAPGIDARLALSARF